MTPADPPRDLTRTLLVALCFVALIAAVAWIVRPFLAAAIWSATIVIVTWPLMLAIEKRAWNSRSLAIAAMVIILSLLIAVPLLLAVATVVANAGDLFEQVRSLAGFRVPPPPDWLARIPMVGDSIARSWQDAAAAGLEGLRLRLAPYAGGLTRWFVVKAGDLGSLAIQTLLTLVFSVILYAYGERAGAAALQLGRRLGGEQGEELVRLAANAVRGVALGVGVTAAIQSVLGGAGLAVAGVPFAGVLTAVLFLLCIAQVGMLILLIPAALWLFASGETGWAVFLVVWSLAASLLDNVIRPFLVRRSAKLPLLLVFVGVVGGLLAFGLLGVFVGPVVLAVAYTLLVNWMNREPQSAV